MSTYLASVVAEQPPGPALTGQSLKAFNALARFAQTPSVNDANVIAAVEAKLRDSTVTEIERAAYVKVAVLLPISIDVPIGENHRIARLAAINDALRGIPLDANPGIS